MNKKLIALFGSAKVEQKNIEQISADLDKELYKLKSNLLKVDPGECIKTIQKLNKIIEDKPNKYNMYKKLL